MLVDTRPRGQTGAVLLNGAAVGSRDFLVKQSSALFGSQRLHDVDARRARGRHQRRDNRGGDE